MILIAVSEKFACPMLHRICARVVVEAITAKLWSVLVRAMLMRAMRAVRAVRAVRAMRPVGPVGAVVTPAQEMPSATTFSLFQVR